MPIAMLLIAFIFLLVGHPILACVCIVLGGLSVTKEY